jgi:hypothetical protein
MVRYQLNKPYKPHHSFVYALYVLPGISLPIVLMANDFISDKELHSALQAGGSKSLTYVISKLS